MMEDEPPSLEGKGLLNMRVVDLKLELEKRGLSKSGSKKDLVKRLKQQLEFEKLCEERKSGDFPMKLELDAKTQENEFVQQYLAQQQKRYAEREQEKRQLADLQKCQEGCSTVSCEHQSENDNASSDTDDKDNEEEKLVNKPKKELQSHNIDDKNVMRKSEDENASSDADDKDNVDKNLVNKPSEKELQSQNTDDKIVTRKSEDESTSSGIDDTNNEKQNLGVNKASEKVSQSQNTNDKNVVLLKSVESHNKDLYVPESESKPKCIQESTHSVHSVVPVCDSAIENQSENYQQGKDYGNQTMIQNISNVTENEDIKLSVVKCASETVIKNLSNTEHSKETDNRVHMSENTRNTKEISHSEKNISNLTVSEDLNIVKNTDDKFCESGKCQNSSSFTSEEVQNTVSFTSPERTSSDYLPKQKTAKKMEVSDCTPVPYSLSDIQLPESPGSHTKSEDTKCEERSQIEHGSDAEGEKNCHSDKKKKSNGKTTCNLNSSREDMSESETKDSSYSNDSPEKMKKEKRHSDESSDGDSDKNSSPYKKKSLKYEDTSSNLAGDSDNEYSKNTVNKEKKFVKTQRNTDESDNGKSTDSEKYNRRIDSKRKSRDKRRKRDSRSSSSSSRSRSSDSSSERRHSKKPLTAKSKNFAHDGESNQMGDKSSDEKSTKNKKNLSTTESSTDTVSVKKRLKLKRDNVPIEIVSSKKEPLETSASTKMLEKKLSSHSAPDKPTKQESVEEKEEKPEINYKPRKIVLLNRKLNRKSSENNNAEPRSKKCKWESFAACQKSSHAYGISANSLRNWFPDFKLVSETSIEMEPDEHSLPAIDEKNGDTIPNDTLNENESSTKQESTSQIDMEDSVSQEPHYNEAAELGPASKIIFIQNLVRPFTLNQLKDLLKQNGKIVEEYFWIDKIKSKCFVMYESEKEAVKARNALNNTRWPSSNPKILSVEFSSIEELEKHQKGNEQPPSKPLEQPAIESLDPLEARLSHTVEEHKRKDRERRKEKDRAKFQAPVREWDKDKIVQDSPERERPSKEEKSRSAEKKEKKESKKRANEDTPAKLLDDLFQKTKSVPCIYWLPLTEEQAKAKEEERKMKKLEREKRNQQLKEQEETERRGRRARSSSRRREKENRKSSTRSRSPASRRR